MQDDEALTISCGAHINLYTAPLPEEDTDVLRAWPSVRFIGGSGEGRTLDTYIKSVVPYRLATLP